MNKIRVGFHYIQESILDAERCCENLSSITFDGAKFVRLAQDSWFSVAVGGAGAKLLDMQVNLWPEKDINLKLTLDGKPIGEFELSRHEGLAYRIPIFDKVSNKGARKIYFKCDGPCDFSVTELSLNYMMVNKSAENYLSSAGLLIGAFFLLTIMIPIRSHQSSEK